MTERTLLSIFAHPDDESFRSGGTLALLANRGVHVYVLTATRGQGGSLGNPAVCSVEDLPAVREAELRCACTALRIQPPILLNYQVGHISEADPEMLITDILTQIRRLSPQIMLSFDKDGLSGHPDHIAIGCAAAEAFRHAEGVEAFYTLAVPRSLAETLGMKKIRAVPDEDVTLAVDTSSVWDAKMAAIRCHRTQLGESPILEAPEEKQRLFLGMEHFCLTSSHPDPGGKIANLLEWLKN